MEEQQQNGNTSTPQAGYHEFSGSISSPPQRPKGRLWLFVVGFVGLFVVIGGGYWAWQSLWSPEARAIRDYQARYQKVEEALKTMEDAFRADTYGGKTPQETLDMFVDALKKGDVELASKYFALEDDINDPNYLTREPWESAVKGKTVEELNKIIGILSKVQPDTENFTSEFDYKLISGEHYIDLQLNTFSQVWKIERI